jgi:hypothetical protein
VGKEAPGTTLIHSLVEAVLAQPPDISDTFVREVEENLRRDRLRDFSTKYAGWMIVGVILFLAAAGGWIYWQDYRTRQSEKAVEELAQVFADSGKAGAVNVPQRLDALSNNSSKAVRASGLFARAAYALQQNDTQTAISRYRQIAADKSLPQPYRDLALIRQTTLEFDALKPDQVIARLQPLAKPGTPWFGSAGELTAMALIKQGKKADAGRLLTQISKDPGVPDAMRARASQLASTLGVDINSATTLLAQ